MTHRPDALGKAPSSILDRGMANPLHEAVYGAGNHHGIIRFSDMRVGETGLLLISDDGTRISSRQSDGATFATAWLDDGTLLIEAPGRALRSFHPPHTMRPLLRLGAEPVIGQKDLVRLRCPHTGLYLRQVGGQIVADATSEMASTFTMPRHTSTAGPSLIKRLPPDLTCDRRGLTALFAIGDPELAPVVELVLDALDASAVRQSWSAAQGPAKDPFFDAVRTHGIERLSRFRSYTADILAADAAKFGWDIGANTYGKPLIFEPFLGKLTIGKYCSLADPAIVLGNHGTRSTTTYPFMTLWAQWPGAMVGLNDHVAGDVVIGNDVWIGYQSIILPGARIGDGSIVGAGSVVSGRIPPYSICTGNPGKVRGARFRERIVTRLMETAWWNWTDAKVDRYLPLLLSNDIDAFLDAAAAERTSGETNRPDASSEFS